MKKYLYNETKNNDVFSNFSYYFLNHSAVNKFLKEVTLLNQAFVKDDKQTIQNLLDSKGAKIHNFTLYVVGEGIEKLESDFAAEVAEASKI